MAAPAPAGQHLETTTTTSSDTKFATLPPHIHAKGCGASAPEGKPFSACAGCRRAAFCGRDCLRAAWPAHKAVCRPDALRADVPAERAAAAAIKRGAVGQLLPLLAAQLSVAATAWHARHGKGAIVAWMDGWANLAAPARAADCQLYVYFVPLGDLRRHGALAAVAAPLHEAGGERRVRALDPSKVCCAVLCCAVLCCAVLCAVCVCARFGSC